MGSNRPNSIELVVGDPVKLPTGKWVVAMSLYSLVQGELGQIQAVRYVINPGGMELREPDPEINFYSDIELDGWKNKEVHCVGRFKTGKPFEGVAELRAKGHAIHLDGGTQTNVVGERAESGQEDRNGIPLKVKDAHETDKVDVAIITVLPEEYKAVMAECGAKNCRLDSRSGRPNTHAWRLANIRRTASGGPYRAVIALAGKANELSGYEVTRRTIEKYDARYVLLVGVAGGFPEDDLCIGDVVVSKIIYGYEYGKLGKDGFKARPDLTYPVSSILLTASLAFSIEPRWADGVKVKAPAEGVKPKIVHGNVASGNKVVDDPSNEFWKAVKDGWNDKIHAVEMEGAGAAHAAKEFGDSEGKAVRFLMIRGISDMPKSGEEKIVRTEERDLWKNFASASAARFAVELIRRGWPEPPLKRAVAEN